MQQGFEFTLHCSDSNCDARRSTFTTPHGLVEMPAFMPVATLGTVKGLEIDQVRATGAHMILGNTYHLTLRPGEQVVRELGGLHQFMGWDGPILTDSGGFQIFSLAQRTKVTERGAEFQSHIDGSKLSLTPERSIQIQQALGSDIAMVLDHVVSLPNDDAAIRDACERSIRWAKRCQELSAPLQAQFAIVQGGLDKELRKECAARLAELDFPGYAIGGLSVGEPPAAMYGILDATCSHLPADRPRYLMGVGRPEDLLQGILRGVDMFDCVMPTRNGRNAFAFTDSGPLRMRNEIHRTDDRPLEEGCPCIACRRSRGYIRHLFMASEMLGPILLTAHNLTYYQRLMSDAREAIEQNRFVDFFRGKMAGWGAPAEIPG
ncbi:MAG: tRNA guanosine(34) transglycosylase Tgt [Planctomycetales bacterium]|nr:tRNA guanosine(34) transglycosylase Tgt [Planctomycetales bacterium]